MGLLPLLPDPLFLKMYYLVMMKENLDLQDPKTFNQKLQWLKLYDRKDIYTTMVDKYAVKEYVASRIGEEYIIPTLGVWDHFDDIDFSQLPQQFVLKCTHDSGGLVIVKDKNTFDRKAAKAKIEKCLKRNYFYNGREWPYKNVPHRIIAEVYMEDAVTEELRDYKFFCFDGKVKALFVATERQKKGEEVKFDFFDAEYKHLPFRQGHENAKELPGKPLCFDEMKMLAAQLSQGIKHVRVDFYEVNGHVFFGEMTFFHFSGFVPFEPAEWDYTLGSWIRLPDEQ